MKRHLATVLAVLALSAAATVAADGTIVLDDFSHPAWGVRWTTLEFSKHTPPDLTSAEVNGPDGTPAARVELPGGGRIVLTTQQESKNWDGIRGKLPWPLPGTPTRLHLAVQVQGDQPVDVIFIVRDKDKNQTRTDAVTIPPRNQWQDVSVDLPSLAAPAALVGIELKRGGAETEQPQPVLLDSLRVSFAGAQQTLFATAGRTSYDRALVPGEEAELALWVQSLDPEVQAVKVTCRATPRTRALDERSFTAAQYAASGTELWTREVDAGGGRPLVFPVRPEAAGIVDYTFHFDDGRNGQVFLLRQPSQTRQGGATPCLVELVAYPPRMDTSSETSESVRQRLAGTRHTPLPVEVYRTNLSPATLVMTVARQFKLFEGLPAQGLELPKYVAVPQAGGVKVYPTAQAVPLEAMSEPWLVFFAGDAEGWDRIRIIPRRAPRGGPTGPPRPAPIDAPWLVVLQHKARQLSRQDDALVLDFASPAGHVSLMPLRGIFTFEPDQTARWAAQGFPADQAAHAQAWARRLQRFPLHVQEDFRVNAADDVVTVRQQFEYIDLGGNDWGVQLEPYAPVPPMLAMAQQNRFPIRFLVGGREVPVADLGVASAGGPISGVSGADGYEYHIEGVLKYINEDRLPVTQGGGPQADSLRELIRTQSPPVDPLHGEPRTSPSRHMPGLTIREDYGIAMVGNSERQGLIGATIPYFQGADALWRKRTLLVDALFLLNPHIVYPLAEPRTGRIYNMEGLAWGRFRGWVDNNAYAADILRALGYYAQYTGDVELIRRHWPSLRASFAVVCDFQRHGEWELSCFDTGGGDTWDSVCNGVIGFARLADMVGDSEAYRYACYYFAKRAATLPGHRQANVYAAAQPYWPSLVAMAQIGPDGTLREYALDEPRAARPVATIEDLAFSDVWGGNFGLRPWNETVWMRASRAEYRMCAELTPDYGRYWLEGQVKKFAPQWYQRVLVEHRAPGDAVDLRTGEKVKPGSGSYVGTVNLQARAIVLGETLEQLWPLLALRAEGVRVGGSDGRVPRLPTYVALLEDATAQPWVRLYGKDASAGSDQWQRGRDAYMELGDQNYILGLSVAEDGAQPMWNVLCAPKNDRILPFGNFGPAGVKLRDVSERGVSWNTTVFTAGTR